MLQRPLLRRACARVDQFLRTGRFAASPPASRPEPPATAATADGSAVGVGQSDRPDALIAPAVPTPPEPCEPLEPHHRQGLALARAHRWNWAQRALEQAVRISPQGPAADDLASVRAVRRQLRLLQKWPRDAGAHVELGRCYLELDMGEAAAAEFRRVIALAPAEPAAYFYLALEYAYRGALGEAEQAYAQAQARVAGLPPFAALLAEWHSLATGEALPPADEHT